MKRIEIKVSTSNPKTIISPFPSRGYKGIFDKDKVYIETEDDEIINERSNPKSFFRSFRHNLWWDYLDALYFIGYASWNYLCTPFLLLSPEFEIFEIEPWDESGEICRRLRVVFPETIPTHSQEQIFYFNSQGLLNRLDYTAEVVGNWAKAAHYCSDYKNYSGIVIPTKRRVFPRRADGKARNLPLFVSIDVEDIMLS